MIEKYKNPGCQNCKHILYRDKFQGMHSPGNTPICKNKPIKYYHSIKGLQKELEYCIIKNKDNICKEFTPSLLFKIISFFNGNWCYSFGHKLKPTNGIASDWYCTRCNYIDKHKWPEMPEVKNYNYQIEYQNNLLRTKIIKNKTFSNQEKQLSANNNIIKVAKTNEITKL